VGGAIPITMLELAQKVNDRFGGRQRIEIFKNNVLDDPHPIYKPNCSKAKNTLGLEHYTDLDTALDKTIEWEKYE
jgi:nucleoside-diphosphate-sugar epimerase